MTEVTLYTGDKVRLNTDIASLLAALKVKEDCGCGHVLLYDDKDEPVILSKTWIVMAKSEAVV